jgi:NADP-dependent 3-hydroxy acid dehydrogenase YdfG
MARELGPQGVHVAHTIIDGLVDGKFAREHFTDVEERAGNDQILSPDDIAQTYVNLWQQSRSAWTHELDLRPWTETF